MIKECEQAVNHIADCEHCKRAIVRYKEEMLKLPPEVISEITLEVLEESKHAN